MPESVTVAAPAKVNLFLDITGVTPDGYHTLDTVMQSVSLFDYVTIKKREDGNILVSCDYPHIPQDDGNIAFRAAQAFCDYIGVKGFGADISINKSIPAQAGLAGGSADAAAVIVGLNILLKAGLSVGQTREIGLKAGADVPFCVSGGCMRARGKGEVLTPLPGLLECYIVLAKPKSGVDTKEAYSRYDALGGNATRRDPLSMLAAIRDKDLENIAKEAYNIFDQVCSTPETAAIHQLFAQHRTLGTVMTGSGSAVAGIFGDAISAAACESVFKNNDIWVYTARPVSHGAIITETG